MTVSPDVCLTRLKADFEAAFVASEGGDGTANTIYGHRTNPGGKTRVGVSLAYDGRSPAGGGSAAGGAWPVYKMIAMIGVTMDTDESGRISEAELAAADAALIAIEEAIYAQLGKGGPSYYNEYWNKVQFVDDSQLPPLFSNMPTVRYGFIPFRLIMR